MTKTIANISLYTIGEIIPRILSFLLLPILTKYLTTKDYGISGYTTTITSFLYVFTVLSVNTYALRSYYKFESELERKKLLGNLFLFLTGWGLILLCLESLLFPLLLNIFSVQVPFYPYFLLALIINFFDIISVIPLIIYRLHENAKGFVLLSVGRTILQYVLVLFLVVYYNMGLLGSYLGRLAACFPFIFIYFLIIKRKGFFNIDFLQIKDALKFSLPLLPGAISYLVISLFDRVILERYVSLSELGIYSVAATLALSLNIVIQGIYRSFEQKIFREHNNAGYSLLVDKLYKTYIAALYIPGFLIVLFSKDILLFLTSPQYYSAAIYIVYLVIAVIISGMNTFLGTVLIADNRRKIITYSSSVSAGISFIANLLLIKYFGVMGACVASILSFLIVYTFYHSKVGLQNKYLIHQIFFVATFLSANYLIPAATPLGVAFLIKLLLVAGFILLVIKTMDIELPRPFLEKKATKEYESSLPLVSVIIPCYNVERYVEEAIRSIMNQSYSNLEIIAIDDCSADNTLSILERLSEVDKRIKLVKNEKNLKLVAALNKGISLASGKYIARMDADDISLPNRIELQVNFLEQNDDIALCGCNYLVIDDKDNQTGKVGFPSEDNILKAELLFFCPFGHPTVMIKKEVLDTDGCYEEGLVPAEDYELWVRIAKQHKIANIPAYLLRYRWHGNNISIVQKEYQQHALEKVLDRHVNSFGFKRQFFNYHLKFIGGTWYKKTSFDEINGFTEWKKALVEKNQTLRLFNDVTLKKTFDKYYSLALLSIIKSKANTYKIKLHALSKLILINPAITIKHFFNR